LVAVNA